MFTSPFTRRSKVGFCCKIMSGGGRGRRLESIETRPTPFEWAPSCVGRAPGWLLFKVAVDRPVKSFAFSVRTDSWRTIEYGHSRRRRRRRPVKGDKRRKGRGEAQQAYRTSATAEGLRAREGLPGCFLLTGETGPSSPPVALAQRGEQGGKTERKLSSEPASLIPSSHSSEQHRQTRKGERVRGREASTSRPPAVRRRRRQTKEGKVASDKEAKAR
jgi:hypothetical protein